MKQGILLLLLLLSAYHSQAQQEHIIGGSLSLNLREIGLSTPGSGGQNTRNSFGLELSFYHLWETAGQKAFGLRWLIAANGLTDRSQADRPGTKSISYGLAALWRLYIAAPSSSLQLWLQPAVSADYSRQSNQNSQGENSIHRSYTVALGVQPGLIWQFANRWRLSIALGGLRYSYNTGKVDGQQGSNYFLGLDLQLNPATAQFGIAYRL